MHCFPERFGGVVEKDSAVQQSVGIGRGGPERNRRCFFTRGGMSERGVGAIFTFPTLRCPAIVIKVADTRVICSDPILTGKCDIKDLIHILVDGDISVDEDAGLVGGQLEGSELGPRILESGRYEGSLPVFG